MYRQTVANSQWECYYNGSATDQMILVCQMLKEDRNIKGQCTDCFTKHNGIYQCICVAYVSVIRDILWNVPTGTGISIFRLTGKQITFGWCIVGHMYSYVKELTGRQEWERLTGFIWGSPLVNTIYDQFPNGGDAVAVCSDGILYWIHVAVDWRGFYNWNVFKWTCSKSEQSGNWMVHFVYEAVRCLFTKLQLARLI